MYVWETQNFKGEEEFEQIYFLQIRMGKREFL